MVSGLSEKIGCAKFPMIFTWYQSEDWRVAPNATKKKAKYIYTVFMWR